MKLFRKLIALLVSISLIGGQVALADGEWFQVPYGNITKPNQDSMGFFGGGIEYRFSNEGQNWKPWIDFQGPKIKAGCNGLSINLGFAQLSGLEKLPEQLANAAQALMWGLLIALINSLPSLEHVFSKIKEMINWIQQMLRNACNIGKAMGNALVTADMGDGESFKDKTSQITNALTDWGGGLANEMMDMDPKDIAENIKDKLSSNSNTSDTSDSEAGKIKDQTIAAARNVFSIGTLIAIASRSILETEFKYNKDKKGQYAPIKEVTIDGSKSKSEQIYLIMANLIGDDGADANTLTYLTKGVSEIFPQLLAKGKVKDAEQQLNDFSNALANGMKKQAEATQYSYQSYIPPAYSGADFISQLINGGSKNNKIKVRKMKAVGGWAVGERYTFELLQPSGWAVNNGKYEEVEIEWKGFKKESEEALRCYIGLQTNCDKNVNEKIIDLSLIDKLNKTAQLIKARKGEASEGISNSELDQLLDPTIKQLASVNAYYIMKYLFAELEDRAIQNANKKNSSKIAEFNARVQKFKSALGDVKKQLIDDIEISNLIENSHQIVEKELQKMQSQQQNK